MDQYLLSICIPTYNRLFYLKQTLQCLLDQISELGEPIVEICISDNDSTDGTYLYISNLKDTYNFIRISKNDFNLGPDCNFIKALLMGRGKYLWLFGDDDFILNKSIFKITQKLKNGDYDCVWLNYAEFNFENNNI